MRYLFLFSLPLLLWACQAKPAAEATDTPPAAAGTTATEAPAPTAFLIKPGLGFGAIKPGMTSADLTNLLGVEQIQEAEFYLGEGYYEPGLLLYPGTSQELSIHLTQDTVSLVQLTQDYSAWRTADSITVGSTLQEVVAANGSAFELMGFEWDYGGTVTDWKGGEYTDKGLLMRFTVSYGKEQLPEEDIRTIMGDQVLSSDNPILAKYLVTVIEITQR